MGNHRAGRFSAIAIVAMGMALGGAGCAASGTAQTGASGSASESSVASAASGGAASSGTPAAAAGGGSASASASTVSCTPTNASATTSGGSAQNAQQPPEAGGQAGGGAGQDSSTALGTVTQTGGTLTKTGETINATDQDTSGVLATDAAAVTLTDVKVTTSGSSSSSDSSSFTGLDAGVLANGGSQITMSGGSITTTGDGANAAFAYGTGSSLTIASTSMSATGQYAHGIMASGGGTVTAKEIDVVTAGNNGAAVATDRGGGTMNVTNSRVTTCGYDSPGLYSTGSVQVISSTVDAQNSEVAVIEGSNSITITDSALTGSKKSGFMIMQSMSGDAEGADGVVNVTGGSVTQAEGPLLFVTNSTGTFNLTGVNAKADSGILLKAAADKWGTTGSNGGHATLNATRQVLSGDVVVDDISEATLALTQQSKWTGALNTANSAGTANVNLDSTSTWTVTADSHVAALTGAVISGTSVANITGNGHNVYYSAAANPALGGATYSLAGGGQLLPG